MVRDPAYGRQSGLTRTGLATHDAWIVVVVGFGLWESWQDANNLFERVLLVGGVSVFGLILTSVLLDRRQAMKTDRYREVRK